MSKTIKPEKQKSEHFQTQRWENEGGNSVESEHTIIAAGRFVKPLSSPAGTQDLPRQWSSTFVIEPFQAGAGFGLMEENVEGKRIRIGDCNEQKSRFVDQPYQGCDRKHR